MEAKIDVIIPVYNNAEYIRAALLSVLNQIHKVNKVFVIDDCSPTDTLLPIKDLVDNKQVFYYKNKQNSGPNFSRQFGFSLSNAEYIALLDSDDIWYENKLQEQLNIFTGSTYKNLGVVYCNYVEVNNIGEHSIPATTGKINPEYKGEIYEKLLLGNYIMSSASGVLIRSEFLKQAGGFDPSLRVGEDWETWIRLAQVCEYDYSEKVLVKIRKHANNFQSNKKYVFENEIELYKKLFAIPSVNQEVKNKWSYYLISKIVEVLPNKQFINLATSKINPSQRKQIFAYGMGSIRLYAARIILVHTFKDLKFFARKFLGTILRLFIKLFSLIRP